MNVARSPESIQSLAASGEIGGRTLQIAESGAIECAEYAPAPLPAGSVRIRTVRSAISSGTELTYHGGSATNVHLRKHWNKDLRLFEAGESAISFPLVIGYRAAGEVVESASAEAPLGLRVYGRWHHTELTVLPAATAAAQQLPDGLSWDDGVDCAHMGPICVNAVACAEGEHAGGPAVVFGAGVIGLITAQVVRATGADPVYVVDRVPERLRIAEELGLRTVDARADADVAKALKRAHGSDGIAVAWECTGSTRALHEAIRSVRRRGAVVAVGFYQDEAVGLLLGEEFHHNGIRILSAQIGNVHPTETLLTLRGRTIELTLAGQLRLGGLPRLTVPVERAAEGVAALRRPSEVLQVSLAYERASD